MKGKNLINQYFVGLFSGVAGSLITLFFVKSFLLNKSIIFQLYSFIWFSVGLLYILIAEDKPKYLLKKIIMFFIWIFILVFLYRLSLV